MRHSHSFCPFTERCFCGQTRKQDFLENAQRDEDKLQLRKLERRVSHIEQVLKVKT